MTLESFFTKLNQNIEEARQTLRQELSKKVNFLAEHMEEYSRAEFRGELENLVEDFLSQFTSIYQEVVSYVEDEIPNIPKPTEKSKKRKKPKEKTEAQKKEFVRPTYVHRAFKDEGLRISKDARPKIMDLLNKKIHEDIELIKSQLPAFVKGDKTGEKKRITIKPEDLSEEILIQPRNGNAGKELETIPLDLNGHNYKLQIFLKKGN